MGFFSFVMSRFRRKKSTTEVLEGLETKIQSIEERGKWTQEQHRRVIGHMMAYSVGIYVLFAIIYYFVYTGRSESWFQKMQHASPLLILPILVIMLRSSISWYYSRKLHRDRTKLNKFREEKKKILEEVMNTETYKVAKEILDKYGNPEQSSKALKPFVPTANVPGNTPPNSPATPGQLRQRQLALHGSASTPSTNNVSVTPAGNGLLRSALKSEQLPRPLLGHRSPMERVVDYLLSDGPNVRYALICGECFSHNGMAMEEEFEFTSFYCAYCRKFNPSRKQKPRAPPLMLTPVPPAKALSFNSAPVPNSLGTSSSSESEEEKASDSGSARRSPSTGESETKSPEEKKID